MNQFFYESRGKEKIKDLLAEGVRSQTANRLTDQKPNRREKISKLLISLLTLAGIIGWLIR
jgi:hypothetical protein